MEKNRQMSGDLKTAFRRGCIWRVPEVVRVMFFSTPASPCPTISGMKSTILRLVPVILLGLSSLGFAGEPTEAGIAAAKAWLGLVDEKQYKESWVQAAPYFQEKVPEGDWVKMISSVRSPLGAVKSRELLGAQFLQSLPGAPDGDYVVMQFRTSFENRSDAVETVTPMKDPQGVWRVSGYFIK